MNSIYEMSSLSVKYNLVRKFLYFLYTYLYSPIPPNKYAARSKMFRVCPIIMRKNDENIFGLIGWCESSLQENVFNENWVDQKGIVVHYMLLFKQCMGKLVFSANT